MDIYKTSIFKFIAGDMLVDRPVTLTIDHVEIEEIITPTTGEVTEKPILFFKESKRPLILNKTNAATLAKAFGRETEGWTGKAVELYAETVKAFGKVHNAARVRVAKIQKQADKIKSEKLTAEQRRTRRAENTNLMRGNGDEGPIGEGPEPEPQIAPVDLYKPIEMFPAEPEPALEAEPQPAVPGWMGDIGGVGTDPADRD